MPILDQWGNPIKSSNYAKGPAPITGEAFAPRWAGDLDKYIFQMPGGGLVMFDLSKLTLADFRTMRDHYQINATLCVLAFMLHQMDWKIECDNKKIKTMVEDNIHVVWTILIKAISQAFWAGYSPNILQWENGDRYLELTKIKDLVPEECCVEWDKVKGWAPPGHIKPDIRVFNGIKVWGQNWPVPTENSFWYPLLMENGDYYGKKLLRPVFPSWYFSILMHLFANRYFERFGEPVPVGRASYEDEITVGNKKILGADLMVQILQNLRNRSVVVLPNDRSPTGVGTATEFDYNIDYLESQMRGADFERYLTRLDEEMSLGLFTPLLILRTADVGSYNLGSTHWNMYLNMLHAISGDAKYYIDNFILSRLVDFNFGLKAPRAKIVFRKMGDDRKDIIMAMLQAMVASDKVKPDINQIGEIAGLTLTEIKEITDTGEGSGNPKDPNAQPTKKPEQSKTGGTNKSDTKKKATNSKEIVSKISARLQQQVAKAVRDKVDSPEYSFGYESQLASALDLDGAESGAVLVAELYRISLCWLSDIPLSYFDKLGHWDTFNFINDNLTSQMCELLDEGW